MHRRSRLRSALAVAALTALVVGGASAIGASGQDTTAERSSAEPATAQTAQKRGKRGPRGKRGKPGPRGRQGPVGPQGAPGQAGPPGDATARRLSFTIGAGAGPQTAYEDSGVRLDATCGADFAIQVRPKVVGSSIHAFAVGDLGTVYSAGFASTGANDTIELAPPGEEIVSGTLQYTRDGGAHVTLSYLAARRAARGDCLLSGTIVSA